MIISHKNKYVFIQVPRTGSTAIAKELCEKYEGKEILHKHANYFEFLKKASNKEKKYYVFASVRNPMDEAVSLYLKFYNNHRGDFTNKTKTISKGGWVSKRRIKFYNLIKNNKLTFKEFLKKFYWRVYTSNIDINEKYCDRIIRYENLQEDFDTVLKELNIKKKRDIPKTNPTKKKRNFMDFYDKDTLKYAKRIYAPFMKKWSYDFPEAWEDSIDPLILIEYHLMTTLRLLYLKLIRKGILKNCKWIRNLIE